MHHPTDKIAHTTTFVTPVVEHWLEREIAQLVHPMKDRSGDPSHHERTLLPRSYISLHPHKTESKGCLRQDGDYFHALLSCTLAMGDLPAPGDQSHGVALSPTVPRTTGTPSTGLVNLNLHIAEDAGIYVTVVAWTREHSLGLLNVKSSH